MDLPEGLSDGMGGVNELPSRGPQRSAAALEADLEPLFLEPGRHSDIYAQHAKILARTLYAAELDQAGGGGAEDEGEDEADLTEEQRLTLAEAAFAWAEREAEDAGEGGEGAGAEAEHGPVIELSEQFLMQRSPLKRKR